MMPTSNFDNTAETIYGWAGKFLDAILTVLTLALQGQKISRPKLEDTHKVGVGGRLSDTQATPSFFLS